MTEFAVRVEGLCKEYVIGGREKGNRTFRESLADAIVAPLRRLRAIGKELPPEERFWALWGVSFDVKPGEVVGIIGRNGAGKSTLLKILSRITEPTRGRVEIRGRVASLLEVGTGFHPELTGRENIYLNGAILGMSRDEIKAKFDEIVAFAEVEKFLDTPVKRYSSGMYVRLAFAVAAHLDPEILIVDEVLAVGDAEFQKKCLGKMRDVSQGAGRTVLFVSHNMAAVRSLCKVAMMLDAGRLVQLGSASNVTDSYLQQYAGAAVCSIATADIPRPHNIGARIRIVALSINEGEPLLHGLEARFDIAFESTGKFEGVAFAVALCCLDGPRIMSVDSDIPGKRYTISEGARGRATLFVDTLHLAPATYLVNVAIRSGDNFLLDYLPSVMTITVLPSDRTPAAIAMRSSGHGGVRYPCKTILELGTPSPSQAQSLNLNVGAASAA